jgi:hypothetical protein
VLSLVCGRSLKIGQNQYKILKLNQSKRKHNNTQKYLKPVVKPRPLPGFM